MDPGWQGDVLRAGTGTHYVLSPHTISPAPNLSLFRPHHGETHALPLPTWLPPHLGHSAPEDGTPLSTSGHINPLPPSKKTFAQE